jgi:Putative zinc binding domain
VRCRLCDSNRLLSVLDLGATPPCEKLLTVDELDLPEPTIPRRTRPGSGELCDGGWEVRDGQTLKAGKFK